MAINLDTKVLFNYTSVDVNHPLLGDGALNAEQGLQGVFAKAMEQVSKAQDVGTPSILNPNVPSLVVKSGDNLTSLVKNYMLSQGLSVDAGELKKNVQQVAQENGLTNANLIFPGQRLQLASLSSLLNASQADGMQAGAGTKANVSANLQASSSESSPQGALDKKTLPSSKDSSSSVGATSNKNAVSSQSVLAANASSLKPMNQGMPVDSSATAQKMSKAYLDPRRTVNASLGKNEQASLQTSPNSAGNAQPSNKVSGQGVPLAQAATGDASASAKDVMAKDANAAPTMNASQLMNQKMVMNHLAMSSMMNAMSGGAMGANSMGNQNMGGLQTPMQGALQGAFGTTLGGTGGLTPPLPFNAQTASNPDLNQNPLTTSAAAQIQLLTRLNGSAYPVLQKTLDRAVDKGYIPAQDKQAVNDKILRLSQQYKFSPDDFAKVALMESDGLNPKSSNNRCHGIIQFCDGSDRGAASAGFGSNPKAILGQSVLQQLDLVSKYFDQTGLKSSGPVHLDDLYLTVLTPAAKSEKRIDVGLPISGPQANYLHVNRDTTAPITRESIMDGLHQNAIDKLGLDNKSINAMRNNGTPPSGNQAMRSNPLLASAQAATLDPKARAAELGSANTTRNGLPRGNPYASTQNVPDWGPFNSPISPSSAAR